MGEDGGSSACLVRASLSRPLRVGVLCWGGRRRPDMPPGWPDRAAGYHPRAQGGPVRAVRVLGGIHALVSCHGCDGDRGPRVGRPGYGDARQAKETAAARSRTSTVPPRSRPDAASLAWTRC
uniref:Uncharacterized protein n=1 Tax=Arundo donax TaxID=35708 RepID=A0A0A9CD93_ARUDO